MSQSIEVLYNGVCPVCRAGACDLERRAAAAKAGVVFTDVAANPAALARAGVTLDAVRLTLHAIKPSGQVLRGMPRGGASLVCAAAVSFTGSSCLFAANQMDRCRDLSCDGSGSLVLEPSLWSVVSDVNRREHAVAASAKRLTAIERVGRSRKSAR